MKIFSLIFPLYILMLVVSPAIGEVFADSKAGCCQEVCSDREEDRNNNARNSGCSDCSLFSTCSCYPGFIPVITEFSINILRDITTKFGAWNQSLSSEEFTSFWQPPKLSF